jgi:hypothetical protein
MESLSKLELLNINGGEDGDFALLNGYLHAKLIRSFETVVIPYQLYKWYKANF